MMLCLENKKVITSEKLIKHFVIINKNRHVITRK